MQVEQRTGDQFGDPAAAGRHHRAVGLQRPVVHGLDQLDVRLGEQRAEDAGDQGGVELAQVGVHEADDLAVGDQQRTPQHLALAGGGGQPGQDGVPVDDGGPGLGGDLGGAVDGAGVDHHQLVHQRESLHQLPPDDPDDLADGGLLVQGGQDDADGARRAEGALGGREGVNRSVGRGPRAPAQPGRGLGEERGGRFGGHCALLDGIGWDGSSRVADGRVRDRCLRIQSSYSDRTFARRGRR